MTLVSHSKKFIFIHIYKTAGTAIIDRLIKYCCYKDRLAHDYYLTRKLAGVIDRTFGLWDYGRSWLTGYQKHEKAVALKQILGSSDFDRYYKFAYVRNSWDWLASLYFYIKRTKAHVDYEIANKLSFSEFLKYYLESNPPLQLDFLRDEEGKILVDRIGRFSNLYGDFAEILSAIGIEGAEQIGRNLKIKNQSNNRVRDYKVYYDSASVELVQEYFREDIECFQFEFDTCDRPIYLSN
ncbi:MAG: sulfotransferase family 2 domain-containing protein [Cyanobacteria bacterium P01_G01_bin.19]